jgi:DNA polymerase-3 subunit gamma/tau
MSGAISETPTTTNQQQPAQVNEPQVELNQPVTDVALKQAWKEYAVTIEKENPRLFSILNHQIPLLENGVVIKLELRSQMQEGELMKEKNALFIFLKEKLKNNKLELKTAILTEVQEDKQEVFTANDKLRVMMDKNPALAKLKLHFNLDLD